MGATQPQSHRPPNRNTQSQGRRAKWCISTVAAEQLARKALAGESLARNRNDRRDAQPASRP
eukprot:9695417-Alexandrium_andersonii.AAC.1